MTAATGFAAPASAASVKYRSPWAGAAPGGRNRDERFCLGSPARPTRRKEQDHRM